MFKMSPPVDPEQQLAVDTQHIRAEYKDAENRTCSELICDYDSHKMRSYFFLNQFGHT